MPQSTILVTLFSSNPETTGQLAPFLQSIQDGLDVVPDHLLPNIHCLYHRESSVYQYQLTKNGSAEPPPNSIIQNPPQTILGQLTAFFEFVKPSITDQTRVYWIVGAHGRSTGQHVSGIINRLMRLLRYLFSFDTPWSTYRARIADAWRGIDSRSLPVGSAFSTTSTSSTSEPNEITLTELNDLLLDKFDVPLKTLVLHSCSLSSLETIYEISYVDQHIACEADLEFHMDASGWIADMAGGNVPDELCQAANSANGIFSSHTTGREVDPPEFIGYLNDLGIELKLKMDSHEDEINKALNATDAVDVCQFCDNLQGVCPEPVLTNLKRAVGKLQLEYARNASARSPKEVRGIGLFMPVKRTTARVANLPTKFKEAACPWVTFLKSWTGQS